MGPGGCVRLLAQNTRGRIELLQLQVSRLQALKLDELDRAALKATLSIARARDARCNRMFVADCDTEDKQSQRTTKHDADASAHAAAVEPPGATEGPATDNSAAAQQRRIRMSYPAPPAFATPLFFSDNVELPRAEAARALLRLPNPLVAQSGPGSLGKRPRSTSSALSSGLPSPFNAPSPDYSRLPMGSLLMSPGTPGYEQTSVLPTTLEQGAVGGAGGALHTDGLPDIDGDAFDDVLYDSFDFNSGLDYSMYAGAHGVQQSRLGGDGRGSGVGDDTVDDAGDVDDGWG